jgi:fructoselysine and glucoselysine-specific PTS system IIC component
MEVTMVQVMLIGLVALFGYCEFFFGTSMLNRPIVLGALVGLALGNVTQGVIIGASLELVWMGMMTIGAALPPEVVSGGVLGTAFAITSGKGPEVALALALPIATLVLLIKNGIYIIIRPSLAHKADKYAEAGNIAGVERMHLLSWALFVIPMAILNAAAFRLGSPVVESILAAVPPFVMKGLSAATGLLPALGFALLVQMIMTKQVAPFFFLGFALAAYLKIPVLGIAFFGIIITFIILGKSKETAEVVVDDGEF